MRMGIMQRSADRWPFRPVPRFYFTDDIQIAVMASLLLGRDFVCSLSSGDI